MGEVTITPGSLASYEDPTRPLSLRFEHVADSNLRGSQYTRADEDATVLAYRDVVSSPVVSLRVIDAGESGFTQVLRSPIVVDLAFGSVCRNDDNAVYPDSDASDGDNQNSATSMCLAVLDEQSNEWECRSHEVVQVRSGVYRSQVTQLSSSSNKMALLQKPVDKAVNPDNSASTEDGNDRDSSNSVDGGATAGAALASAFVLFGGGYAMWRLHRYKTKYRKYKEEMRGQEMPDRGSDEPAQLVVSPLFLAQQQILQKRIADVEGQMHEQQEEYMEGHPEGEAEEEWQQRDNSGDEEHEQQPLASRQSRAPKRLSRVDPGPALPAVE